MINDVNNVVKNEKEVELNLPSNLHALVPISQSIIRSTPLIVQSRIQAIGELLVNYTNNELDLLPNAQLMAHSIVTLTDNPDTQRAILDRHLSIARTIHMINQKTEQRRQITALVIKQKEQMELELPGKIEKLKELVVSHDKDIEQSFQSTIFHQQATVEVLENRIEDNQNDIISKKIKTEQREEQIIKLQNEMDALKLERRALHG